MSQIRIDYTGLNKGLAWAKQYSRRTVPQLVNTSAYWIAINARDKTPRVEVPKIDTELAVIATPVIGKRGKPLKKKKTYAAGVAPGQAAGSAPLAALIIAARARPGSRYNQLTGGRYKLDANPFKGVTRAEGRKRMAELIDKMIKARHKGTSFLLAGWIPAIRRLYPLSVQKFLRGQGRASFLKNAARAPGLGSAKPAAEGVSASATIENDVGGKGVNAPSHNRALTLYGTPALQAAVDQEGKRQMEYALRQMEKELAAGTNKHWR